MAFIYFHICLYISNKSKFRRRQQFTNQLGIGDTTAKPQTQIELGPLSESYVNRGDQRNPAAAAETAAVARDRKPYSLMQTLADSWTDWHIDIWCWMSVVGCSIARRFDCLTGWLFDWLTGRLAVALCRKQYWGKIQNKSQELCPCQYTYQTCLEIKQPIESARQSVRHSVSLHVAGSYWFSSDYGPACCLQCISDILLIEEPTVTLTDAQCVASVRIRIRNPIPTTIAHDHPEKCKYLTTFFRHNQYAIS